MPRDDPLHHFIGHALIQRTIHSGDTVGIERRLAFSAQDCEADLLLDGVTMHRHRSSIRKQPLAGLFG